MLFKQYGIGVTLEKEIKKTSDMTVGNPLKLILSFAIPLFIGNIFQQIYSITDTIIIGHNLGDMAIASIGATGSIYSLLINFALGLNSGYGIIVAQSFGAKNHVKLKQAIATMIVLNLSITFVVTIISLLFLRTLLQLMNIPAEIFENAYSYISIIIGGMLATISYNMFAGIMRAVGNSKTPLYFLILSCTINICLDLLFIMAFGLGVSGAAIATVIAQTFSAILCGIYVIRKYRDLLPSKKDFKLDLPLLMEMSSSGFAMAMMLCVIDIGSVIYQRAINGLGEVLIVSHTAARKIIGMFMMPIGSISAANSTFASQNWGAGKKERIGGALKKVLLLQVGFGLIACAIIFLFGTTIIQLITGTTDSEVIDNAFLSLRLHFICYPALGILFALRTTLQAIGYKIAPIVSSSFELIAKIIAGIWLIPKFGYISACLTEPIIWIICSIYLIITIVRIKPFATNKQ